MKKLINDPEDFVDEMLEGVLLAHPDQLKHPGDDNRVVVRADAPQQGKVGIVTGGGSGHLPLFLGYVGTGLCSGVAVGNVFSSPSSDQCFEATKAVDGGAGVLYLYGNYGGDVLNFDLAADMAEMDDIDVATVLVTDDVASHPKERSADRRGVVGMFVAFKCAGAAAERGDALPDVARVAQKAVDRTGSMGVGLSPTVLPTVGTPTFELADGEMEIGIGVHGEPGTRRGALETADAVVDQLLDPIIEDLELTDGDEVAVVVNSMGATPPEELYVMYRRIHQVLTDRGISIGVRFIGEYATSLEMAGASITITQLDSELKELLEQPACSPFFQTGDRA